MEIETDFCNVIAIIRCDALEQVEQCLQEMGVLGISLSSVNGYGEYADFFRRDNMTTHTRVEVFTTTAQADAVAQAIMEVANSGAKGDGIVILQPISKVYRIRHRAELQPSELMQPRDNQGNK